MIDPRDWTLPDPSAVVATMGPDSDAARRETWVFTDKISSVALYSYLKNRFGEPNGIAMTLRSPSVDNLIHWNYTVASGPVILDVRSLDLRIELTAFLPPDAAAPDWDQLERRLLDEFRRERDGMAAVRQHFEKWRLFVNPHQVLRIKLERQVSRLIEINPKGLDIPVDPRTAEELPEYQSKLAACQAVYEEAMALCLDIHLSAPVFCESAVNLMTYLLVKPEIRQDKQRFDEQRRRNIKVRVKDLHLVCDGFASRIDGSENEFKEFMRLMSRRNDRLHGNVDPTKGTGREVYFDHRFIPLFTEAQGFTRLALENALANMEPKAAIQDWNAARGFVNLLLTKLDRRVREGIELALGQQQLGYRPSTGAIGVILPQVRVGFFPGSGPSPAGDDETA